LHRWLKDTADMILYPMAEVDDPGNLPCHGRQVMGVITEYDNEMTVQKIIRAARNRKLAFNGKCEGRQEVIPWDRPGSHC
jgi:hypothetical protein